MVLVVRRHHEGDGDVGDYEGLQGSVDEECVTSESIFGGEGRLRIDLVG